MWASPNRALTSVVFPDPTGPMTTVNVEGRIWRLTPCNTYSASTDGAIDTSTNSINGFVAPMPFFDMSYNSMPDSEFVSCALACAAGRILALPGPARFCVGRGFRRRKSWMREKHAKRLAACGNPTSKFVMGAETRLARESVANVSAASRPLEELVQNRPPAITRMGVFVVKNCAI